MNTKEKYDSLVSEIEKQIESFPLEKASRICERVAKIALLSERDLSTVFSFMTGQTLKDYIQTRKMVAAYKQLIDNEHISMNDLIDMVNVGDQAACIRKFRRFCGMTPPTAQKEKDRQYIVPPKTWDSLSNQEAKTQTKEVSKQENTKFGISTAQYKKITEAADLQMVYCFDDTLSNLAFLLSERYKVSLRDAFEFVDDFTIRYDIIEDGKLQISEDCFRRMLDAADDLIYLYFRFHLSVNEAFELLRDVHRAGKNVREVDPETLHYYLHSSLTLPEILQAEDDFDPLGYPIDPEEYMRRIEEGYSSEEAVESILDYYRMIDRDDHSPKEFEADFIDIEEEPYEYEPELESPDPEGPIVYGVIL